MGNSLKQFGQILVVVAILGALAGIVASAFVVAGALITILFVGVFIWVAIQEIFFEKDDEDDFTL
ncbi:MAG: hypothetical protein DRQ47_11230 [Gammaproteobacteria bacterium]|nr:MAG: hypothetical protein DRQ47_11230 [Gammaproteobacteria bacterium]